MPMKRCKCTNIFTSQKRFSCRFCQMSDCHCSKKKIICQRHSVALIKIIHHLHFYLKHYNDFSHTKSNFMFAKTECEVISAFYCIRFHWTPSLHPEMKSVTVLGNEEVKIVPLSVIISCVMKS